MAISPVVLSPYDGNNFSTNIETVTFSGTADRSTTHLFVNGVEISFSPNPSSVKPLPWEYKTDLTVGVNQFQFVAQDISNSKSTPTTVVIVRSSDQTLLALVSAPTQPALERFNQKLRISIVSNPEDNVVGYNFYHSFFAGGGVNGYQKLNSTPISADSSSFTKETTEVVSQAISEPFLPDKTLRTTTTVEEVRTTKFYFYDFSIDQQISLPLNAPVGTDDPRQGVSQTSVLNYFVVTAVATDTSNEIVEFESMFSEEVVGSFLILNTDVVTPPVRRRDDIAFQMGKSILTEVPNIDVKPGTIENDLFIGPPSEQLANLSILENFNRQSNSFLTLLQLDDPNGDHESDAVVDSPEKIKLRDAFGLANTTAGNQLVQDIIDFAFDKLAANVNVFRGPATYATGQVVFYIPATGRLPTSSFTISVGQIISTVATESSQAVQFTTLSNITVDINDIAAYLNTDTGNYEFLANIRAVSPGTDGNQDANTIKTIVSGPSITGLKVINREATVNGEDRESNLRLSERAILAFQSVDAGTEAGYLATTLAVPGVQRARIIRAGEPLMQRDYFLHFRPSNPEVVKSFLSTGTVPTSATELKHLGGKVDIYIQGEEIKQVTDVFSFSYQKVTEKGSGSGPKNSTVIVENRDGNVTDLSPIFEVYSIRNSVNGKFYDLTGIVTTPNPSDPTLTPVDPTVLSTALQGAGDAVSINETLINSEIGFPPSSVKYGYEIVYKFRERPKLVLSQQPVYLQSSLEGGFNPWVGQPTIEEQIGITVVGDLSGALVPGKNFYLEKLDDPLLDGNSTISKDAIVLRYSSDPSTIDGGELPVGGTVQVTSENHVVFRGTPEPLLRKGIDLTSITVLSPDRSITYRRGSDYTLSEESTAFGNIVSILVISSGSIANGSIVLVDYRAGENFTVTYPVNNLLNRLDTRVQKMRHVTADVAIKDAVKNSVDIEMTVVVKPNVSIPEIDSRVRTRLSRLLNQKTIGESVYQSDIIAEVEKVAGINYVVVPLTSMVKSTGSYIVRDKFKTTDFVVETFNLAAPQAGSGNVTVYKTSSLPLSYRTGTNGGPSLASPSGTAIETNIPVLHVGIFEDDLPLQMVERAEDVRKGTGRAYIMDADSTSVDAGKVFISPINKNDTPSQHTYTATYFVKDDKKRVLSNTNGVTGAEDIQVTSLEYITLGKLTIIYDTIPFSKGV